VHPKRAGALSASASAGALSSIRAMSLPCGGSALRGWRCGHGVGCCVRLVAQSIINAEGDEGDNNPYEPEHKDVAHITVETANASELGTHLKFLFCQELSARNFLQYERVVYIASLVPRVGALVSLGEPRPFKQARS
jgi:hypothetical protein